MDNDNDLDLNNESNEDDSRENNRFRNLSEKVKLAAEDKAKAEAAKVEAENARIAAEKERDFFKDFSTSSTKYPGASEYQDAIKEKVMAGYSVEDAMVSVLAKEGKLQTPPAPRVNPAGGSAPTALKADGDKPIAEMTQEEKRAILEKNLDIT